MKKVFLFALCAWTLCSCTQKRPAVVEYPAFEAWTGTVEVEKMELSDTATVLHMKAFFFAGNWIIISPESYIKNSDGDEKLIVKRGEGIVLGEKFFMSDSGNASFSLYFPPLKHDVKRIDFIESDCDDCFKIWGLRLLPDDKVKFDPLPDFAKSTTSRQLPPPVFSAEKAKISGLYSGYRKGMSFNEVTIYATNPISSSNDELVLTITPDGTFSGEVAVGFPQIVNSSIGPLFLAPGKETQLYIDLKKSARNGARLRKDKEPSDSVYVFMAGSGLSRGDMVTINKLSKLPSYREVVTEIVGMSLADFSAYIQKLVAGKTEKIKQSGQPEELQKLAIANVRAWAVDVLLSHKVLMKAAYAQASKTAKTAKAYVPQIPDVAYYSFLKDLVSDDLAYVARYGSDLVQPLCKVDIFNLPDNAANTPAKRYEHFREKISPLLGAGNDLLLDVARAKFYVEQLGEKRFFTDEDKVAIKEAFADKPAYAEALLSESDRMKTLTEANKDLARDVPNVPQEKVFDAIVANYKGKVVVVDFWATWCGPCKVALKAMKPLKEEFKGKDVVFVYLTGETSPLATWNRMVKDIDGEHYRVTEAQWSYWYKTFGIEGVPTFMVYDKQGKQQYKATGFPGAEKMKGELEKLLK